MSARRQVLTAGIAPYRLRLRRPLEIAGRRLNVREGWVLRLRDGSGHVGYGDLAPLPGLHDEDTAHARRALVDLAARGGIGALAAAVAASTTGAVRDPESALHTPRPEPAVLLDAIASVTGGDAHGTAVPSVRCGIESAAIGLVAAAHRCSLAQLLGAGAVDRVPVCALFEGGVDTVPAFVRERQDTRVSAVKVKVGRRAPDEEIATVRALRKALGDAVAIRLDANRAFELEQAVRLAHGLEGVGIAWIEEPLANPREIPAFHERTGIGVALDESLRDAHGLALARHAAVRAWIVKPALVGLTPAWQQLRTAPRRIAACVSAAFESGLGLSTLAQLAACSSGVEDGPPDLGDGASPARHLPPAAGLGTGAWLADDLIEPPFDAAAGWVSVAAPSIVPSREFLRTARWERLATASGAGVGDA
jgi:o-succinylbenzoate synthase